jgi:chitin disaccharide deacetylase
MIVLTADDYALTEGISRAIGELAAARRLSATSALVTLPHWPDAAPRLPAHRNRIGVGLHLNFTLGAPLGAMPRLAPDGRFPARDVLVAKALLGLLEPAEIRAEIERQLNAFETRLGFPPDHIDGHEHVHVLSGVRQVLIEVVARRYRGPKPLLRDPSDRLAAIRARGGPVAKALGVRALALGFARAARRRGLPTNRGFSGFSRFDVREPYAAELARALIEPGPRHILMCHPGHRDPGERGDDPIAARRPMEYEALMQDATILERIWRPSRAADGPPVDWRSV